MQAVGGSAWRCRRRRAHGVCPRLAVAAAAALVLNRRSCSSAWSGGRTCSRGGASSSTAAAPRLDAGSCSRRAATLLPGLLPAGLVPPAGAEEAFIAAEELPALKVVRSQLGNLEMEVPVTWRTSTDESSEKLIFAFGYAPYQKLVDYMALRAEQFDMGSLLRGELREPSPEDLVADSWTQVIRGQTTPEQVSTWIFRRKTREAAQGGLVLQGTGGKAVSETQGPALENTVMDAALTAERDGVEGSVLSFHVRTEFKTTGQAGQPDTSRYWSAKALLQKGVVTVGYITAAEVHWQQLGDGPYLERIVGSLRLAPPVPTTP
mmetsp:Transcript_131956/g.282223  ORF Transcript_131956/g.282223 Transcript_131956/m.282223 type:complete len:320 (+) Transcript_131956:26-985(+)